MKETTLLTVKHILATLGLLNVTEDLIRAVTPSGHQFRHQMDQMTRHYSQFIHDGDLCFDIGANLGTRIEVFLKLGGTVVAVEPLDNCIRYLHAKYRRRPGVILVHRGLSDTEGEREFFISSNDSRSSSMSSDWISSTSRRKDWDVSGQWDVRRIVPVTTLDRLIEQYGKPAFCKIDVEGFEYQVLKGLSQPLKALSFEYQPAFIGAALDCVKHLLTLGKYAFNYSRGESMQMALSEWVDGSTMCEILGALSAERAGGDVYARLLPGSPQKADEDI